MGLSRTITVTLGLVAVVVLSGCAGFLAGESSTGPDRTVTPVSVPEDDSRAMSDPAPETATPQSHGPNGRALAAASVRNQWVGITAETNRSAAAQPRYFSLRPNCERPPTQVVQIQVGALQTNDPATDAGIRTAWTFAAPSNQAFFGSYQAFAETITTQYRPLLDAETVAYEPLERDGDVATQRVSVRSSSGEVTSYDWRLTNQSSGPNQGCWMTASVGEIGTR